LSWTIQPAEPKLVDRMGTLPAALDQIAQSFQGLSEVQRRDLLLTYAAEAPRHRPRAEETYVLSDERIDPGCIDTVGLYLRRDDEGRLHLRASFGPEVQTLTRALVAILCRGLEGATVGEAVDLSDEFVPLVAGEQLLRQRGRSVYHVTRRLREAAMRILQPETPALPCPTT
jgi:cysteine desulfuration protein SufE